MPDAPKPPDLWELVRAWVYQTFGLGGVVAVALLSGVVLLRWQWDTIRKLPGVAPLLAWRSRRAVPKADPHRFSVMAARIAGDANDTVGNQIFEVLREFDGIQTLPLDRTVGGPGRMDEEEQTRLFLTSVSTSQGSTRRQVAPEIGSTIRLPDVFWEDLAKVLRLVVASRAAEFGSRYLADRLPGLISATQRLLDASAGRPGWDADARGATLAALAYAWQRLAHRAGRTRRWNRLSRSTGCLGTTAARAGR